MHRYENTALPPASHPLPGLGRGVRRRGAEAAQLIGYPGEFHELSRPSFIKDRILRYLDWFDRHLLVPEK